MGKQPILHGAWEDFMRMERRQLRGGREGKLRRALGVPLEGESVEQLDQLGEEDREQGSWERTEGSPTRCEHAGESLWGAPGSALARLQAEPKVPWM